MDCPSDELSGEVPAAAGPGSPEAADVSMSPRVAAHANRPHVRSCSWQSCTAGALYRDSLLGLEAGEPRYDDLERKLSQRPNISVPAITIASDFDGPAADGAAYARNYAGPHGHRILKGIGHNVPQEAPDAFARAVIDVARSGP